MPQVLEHTGGTRNDFVRDTPPVLNESERIRQLLVENSCALASAMSPGEVLELFLLHAARALGAPSAALLRHISDTEHEFLVVARDQAIVPKAIWPDEPMMHHAAADTRGDKHGVIARILAGESVWVAVDDALADWAPSAAEFHRRAGHRDILLSPYYIGQVYGGYVGFAFKDSRRSALKLDTIDALRSQASVALELQRMTLKVENAAADRERQQASEQRAAELGKANDALQELTDALSTLSGTDAIVEAALRIVARVFRARDAALFDVDPKGIVKLRYWMTGSRILHAQEFVRDSAFSNEPGVQRLLDGFTVSPQYLGQAVRDHRTPVVLDHRAGTSEPDFDEFTMLHNWELELNIPLLTRGEPTGTLCLYRSADDSYSQSEIELASALSKQLSLAMESSRFAEEAREKAVAVERERAALQRAGELESVNKSLEARSRLLSVVAQGSTTLARADCFEQAVQETLCAVGAAASLSRFLVLEEVQQGSKRMHTVFAEWTTDGVITHAEAAATIFANTDATQLLEPLYRGRSYWMRIDEVRPPLRATFERLGIQATGGVPFFIDREYGGCVAFDDCRDVGGWEPDRIDALTTAANAIGGAFQARRSAERLAQERERAALDLVGNLKKANETLRETVQAVARSADFDASLAEVLLLISKAAQAVLGVLFTYDEARNTLCVEFRSEQGQLRPGPDSSGPPCMQGPFDADVTPAFRYCVSQQAIMFADFLELDESVRAAAWPGVIDWHVANGRNWTCAIPVLAGDRPLGIIGLGWTEKMAFTPEQLELLMALSNHAALVMQLREMEQEARAAAITRERELAAEARAAELQTANWALRRSVSRLAEAADIDAALVEAVKTAAEIAAADFGTLGLFIPEEQGFRNIFLLLDGQVHPSTELEYKQRLYALHEEPIRLAWERFVSTSAVLWCDQDGPYLTEDSKQFLVAHGLKGSILVGLKRGAECIGFLGFSSRRQKPPEKHQEELMLAIADQISLMLECSRLARFSEEAAVAGAREQASRQRAEELAKVNEALRHGAEQISSEGNIEAIVQTFLLQSLKTVNAPAGAVFLAEPKRAPTFRTIAAYVDGLHTPEQIDTDPYLGRFRELTTRDSMSIFGDLFRGQMVVVSVKDTQATFPEAYDYHRRFGHEMVWNVPLMLRGRVEGFLGFAFKEDRQPTELEIETLAALAHQVVLALELTRLADEAKASAIARERELAAEGRVAELAKANEALRRGVDSLLSATSAEEILTGLLREAVHVSGASSGAVLRRLGGTEFSYVAIYADGEIRSAAQILQSGTDAEMRRASTLDPTGHFHALIRGEARWRLVDDPALSTHLERSTSFHRKSGTRLIFDSPYSVGREVGGYLGLAFRSEEPPSQSVRETIKALSNQVGLALEFRRISQENERAALQNQRNAFARNLHDTLAQGFTGILMQLGSLEQSTTVTPEVSLYIDRIDELARTNLAEARKTVEELRFIEDAKDTFLQRLAEIARSLRRSFGVEVEIDLSGDEVVFDSRAERELLLIVREALTNSIKHAKASRIGVKGNYQRTSVHLRVWDNGSGFSESERQRVGHYGMRSMQERAEQIGASLTIITELGYGTEIVLSWRDKGAMYERS